MAETTTHKRHKFILVYDQTWAQVQVFQSLFDGWVAADPKHNTKKKFGQMLDVSGDTVRRIYEGGVPFAGGVRPCRPDNDAIMQIAGIFKVNPAQLGWVDDGRTALPEVPPAPDKMPLGVDLEDQTFHAEFKLNPPVTEFFMIPITEFGNWGKKIVEHDFHPWWAERVARIPVMLTGGVRDPHVTSVEILVNHPKFFRMAMSTAMVTGILKGRQPVPAIDAIMAMQKLQEEFDAFNAPAVSAIAAQQDLLGPFRGAVQGLLQLNDELKILVVDSEDAAEGAKDPRIGMIAKRLKTLRKTNQDLLVKLSGK